MQATFDRLHEVQDGVKEGGDLETGGAIGAHSVGVLVLGVACEADLVGEEVEVFGGNGRKLCHEKEVCVWQSLLRHELDEIVC